MIKFAKALPLSSYCFKTVAARWIEGKSISLSPEDNNKDGWVAPSLDPPKPHRVLDVKSAGASEGLLVRFHRQLAQWYGMVEMFFEQLIEGFSRVESGTSSALMNRVIGARWSPQSLAPRGEKPNHWLPRLTSIKATIPASKQASAWSTQIQPVSHWQLPHVGPTCRLGVIFV